MYVAAGTIVTRRRTVGDRVEPVVASRLVHAALGRGGGDRPAALDDPPDNHLPGSYGARMATLERAVRAAGVAALAAIRDRLRQRRVLQRPGGMGHAQAAPVRR